MVLRFPKLVLTMAAQQAVFLDSHHLHQRNLTLDGTSVVLVVGYSSWTILAGPLGFVTAAPPVHRFGALRSHCASFTSKPAQRDANNNTKVYEMGGKEKKICRRNENKYNFLSLKGKTDS